MGVDMQTRELERGWVTINSQVEDGTLYAIQAEVVLYGVAWFSCTVDGAGDLKTKVLPTGEMRTEKVASKDLSTGST